MRLKLLPPTAQVLYAMNSLQNSTIATAAIVVLYLSKTGECQLNGVDSLRGGVYDIAQSARYLETNINTSASEYCQPPTKNEYSPLCIVTNLGYSESTISRRRVQSGGPFLARQGWLGRSSPPTARGGLGRNVARGEGWRQDEIRSQPLLCRPVRARETVSARGGDADAGCCRSRVTHRVSSSRLSFCVRYTRRHGILCREHDIPDP